MITHALQWTEPAQAGLERYFATRLTPAHLEGADAQELRSDLLAHLEEELRQGGVSVVTLEDLRRVLARMGECLPTAESPESPPLSGAGSEAQAAAASLPAPSSVGVPIPQAIGGTPEQKRSGQIFRKPATCGWIRFAGLWWPLLVFGFEVATRGCAGTLFDPMPDLPHHLLVLLVPFAAWFFVRAEKAGDSSALKKAAPWMAGAGLAVATYYMLCFLPVTPFAVLGILAMGIGLLALAPILAFTAMLQMRGRFRKYGSPRDRRLMRFGFWITVLLVVLMELPGVVTGVKVGVLARSEDDPAIWASAARVVRRFGSEKALLRACYGRENAMGSMQMLSARLIVWIASRPLTDGRGTRESENGTARDLYFRVTGKPFDGEALDPQISPWFRTMFNTRENWLEDGDRGGTRVAGQIPGLSLGEGRMDWHCEQASGLTWGEWTMTFKNTTGSPQEARCRISLPPGGFVSRVTLWVNGQPQEAAYSTVSQVRAAYENVAVKQRRDPVLVTQPDEGSVLVQAFPVPAGGQLKTRISFTVPADADSRVWLPGLLERNFEVGNQSRLPLWIQADHGTLEMPGFPDSRTVMELESPTLTASLSRADLTGPGRSFIWRHEAAAMVFCEDPFAGPENKIVLRRESATEVFKAGTVAWVIDTSAPLEAQRGAIEEAMARWSVPDRTAVFLPGDADSELQSLTEGSLAKGRLKFEGGRDNAPALRAAMEWLRGKPDACLIWIHGIQPLRMQRREAVDQLLQRSVSELTLLDVPLIPGENSLSGAFAGQQRLHVVPVRHAAESGSLADAIGAAFRQRGGSFMTMAAGSPVPEGAVRTGDSLARWMARQEATRLAGKGKENEASTMASSHQIVSPWSGAVVLERAEDYSRNGLRQSEVAVSQQIPSIPEPSGVLLLLMSAGHFLLRRRRRRRPRW